MLEANSNAAEANVSTITFVDYLFLEETESKSNLNCEVELMTDNERIRELKEENKELHKH